MDIKPGNPVKSYTLLYAVTGTFIGLIFSAFAETHDLKLVISATPILLGLLATLVGLKQDSLIRLFSHQLTTHRLDTKNQIRELEKVAKFGSWRLDIENKTISWTEGCASLFEESHDGSEIPFEDWLQKIHPAHRLEIREGVQSLIAGANTQFRVVFRTASLNSKGGRWIESYVTSFHTNGQSSQIIATANDITSAKVAQDEVQIYQDALDQATIVTVTDASGNITYANEKFFEISGFEKEEVIGQNHRIVKSDVMPADFFNNMWATISSGKPWRGEICNKSKGSELYWVDTTIVPFVNSLGRITQYVSIRHEITERKRIEVQLKESTKARSEFLANMSHEIRTPMNGIIGMVQLLLDTPINAEQTQLLNVIKNCGSSLMEVINDVLDFSKLEANKVELESREFSISQCVLETIDVFRFQAKEKGLKLDCTINASASQTVTGDPTRIRQILTNLIGNAIKFTQVGSVNVSVNSKQVDSRRCRVEFAVADTGVGIPKSLQGKLFQSFSQVDASTTREFGGTGLGLAISKGLCDKMGGTISFETKPSIGSTFRFVLELDQVAKEEKSNQMDVSAFEGSQRLPDKKPDLYKHLKSLAESLPLRILVAEDNSTNLMVAIGLLKKLGYHADVAKTGHEVVKLLEERHYDIIFMDCQMPVMDGFEATRQILKHNSTCPYIIALSASTTSEDRKRCAEAGMHDFLAKPLLLECLKDALLKYPSKKREIAS
ncbi:MAG: hypothetical protein COT74_03225 [Bdellovibrionales bacterium CG10_big_fil_rev_8_21_14_0_10_45_34]|nr:MAG: hypothetical protein COT74_03225 [Bdellovibrionales bacterium CG10_big_fil_rev_8_21_14_0_10_45_34]